MLQTTQQMITTEQLASREIKQTKQLKARDGEAVFSAKTRLGALVPTTDCLYQTSQKAEEEH